MMAMNRFPRIGRVSRKGRQRHAGRSRHTPLATLVERLEGRAMLAVNVPPVVTVPGPQATVADTPLAFTAYRQNLISVADPNGSANQVFVMLTTDIVSENEEIGTLVGEFTTTDPDAGDTFTYSLVSGTGSTDNASFTIDGNRLRTAAVFDYEVKNSYQVRVRATDVGGLFTEQAFTISVTDVSEAGSMAFVLVEDIGNAADSQTGGIYGDVDYVYAIGKFEVTLEEYCEFLNAVAADDPYGLYWQDLATEPMVRGIQRTGAPGTYSYRLMDVAGNISAGSQSAGNRPVTYVNWFDAARFANWMHNGQGAGSTETGAYELNGRTSGEAPSRNPDALYSIPTEDEWYKAAYYNPTLNDGRGGYYRYATQSNTAPGNSLGASPNQANYFTGSHATTPFSGETYVVGQNYLTDVGAFSGSASYYGTFDQTGNVTEWNDLDGATAERKGVMGGPWNDTLASQGSDSRIEAFWWYEQGSLGFRLVRLTPNSAPSDISLTGVSLPENADIGTLVGEFTTTDPDAGDSFTYTLVDGEGSSDNAAFTIDGHRLRTAEVFDYEGKNSYQVRVRSTDAGGLFTEQAFTIAVTDVSEPRTFEIPAGSSVVVVEPLIGADRMVIRGGGRVILEAANDFSGGVVVEAGELVIRNSAALGSGPLTVRAGAKVSLDVGGGQVAVSQLELAATAALDVGIGKVAIPAGRVSAQTLNGWLASGRNGGAKNGPGIRSTVAAATPFREVGVRWLPDGSVIIGFAAVGDATMDGIVNVQDLIALNAGGRYGSAATDAGWWQGDFNFDGRVNVSDLIALQSSGLYGGGSYLPAPASAGIAVTGVTLTGGATGTTAFVSQVVSDATVETVTAQTTPDRRSAASRARGPRPLDRLTWTALADQQAADDRPAGTKSARWRFLAT